jgi:ribosomal protein S18 acetylase RimI-like enzyme
MPRIRIAVRQDAAQLAQLAERTFRDTFASENTAKDMELHCRNSYGEAQQAAEIENPAILTLLCEEGDALVGFAQLRWRSETPSVVAAVPGEIYRLYVDRAWHGRGIAQHLMQASLDALADRGCDAVWLGVWERNPRAIAFYEKSGFVAVGSHVFTVGTDAQRDVIMTRSLIR